MAQFPRGLLDGMQMDPGAGNGGGAFGQKLNEDKWIEYLKAQKHLPQGPAGWANLFGYMKPPNGWDNVKGDRPDKGGGKGGAGGGGDVIVAQDPAAMAAAAATGQQAAQSAGAGMAAAAGGGGGGADPFSWGPWLDAYGKVDALDMGSIMDTMWRKYGGDNAQDYKDIPWAKWMGNRGGNDKKFPGGLNFAADGSGLNLNGLYR